MLFSIRVPRRLLNSFLLGRPASADARAELDQALTKVSAKVFGSRLRSIVDVDVTARLDQIDAPKLYLRASDDCLVSRSASLPFVSQALNWMIGDLTGPHMLLQAAPKLAANEVSDFLRESIVGVS